MGFTEIETLDQLIQTTERQLVIQKELKEVIAEFKEQQEIFFRGNQTKTHAAKMVQTAAHILTIIEERQMEHLFSPTFMHEVRLFSSIANKKTPGRP